MTSWHVIMTSHLVDFCEQKWSLFHQDDHLIYRNFLFNKQCIGGSKGGGSSQFLSFSCSFRQKSCQIVGFRQCNSVQKPTYYPCLIVTHVCCLVILTYFESLRFSFVDVTAVCILESFENQQSLLMADRVLKELGKTKARDAYKVRAPSHRAKCKRKKIEEKTTNIKGNFCFSLGVRIGLRVHSH